MCVLEGRGVHLKRKPVKQVFKPKAETCSITVLSTPNTFGTCVLECLLCAGLADESEQAVTLEMCVSD